MMAFTVVNSIGNIIDTHNKVIAGAVDKENNFISNLD